MLDKSATYNSPVSVVTGFCKVILIFDVKVKQGFFKAAF